MPTPAAEEIVLSASAPPRASRRRSGSSRPLGALSSPSPRKEDSETGKRERRSQRSEHQAALAQPPAPAHASRRSVYVHAVALAVRPDILSRRPELVRHVGAIDAFWGTGARRCRRRSGDLRGTQAGGRAVGRAGRRRRAGAAAPIAIEPGAELVAILERDSGRRRGQKRKAADLSATLCLARGGTGLRAAFAEPREGIAQPADDLLDTGFLRLASTLEPSPGDTDAARLCRAPCRPRAAV
jgi:hypothetical protein